MCETREELGFQLVEFDWQGRLTSSGWMRSVGILCCDSLEKTILGAVRREDSRGSWQVRWSEEHCREWAAGKGEGEEGIYSLGLHVEAASLISTI